MRRRLAPTSLILRRPPVSLAAAWVAAVVGIAGLVFTHPSAGTWQAFRSYAMVGPHQERSAAILAGDSPSLAELQAVFDVPALAPVAPVEGPVFAMSLRPVAGLPVAEGEAVATAAAPAAPETPAAPAKLPPPAPQAVAASFGRVQALSGAPTTRPTPAPAPVTNEPVRPLTPSRPPGWVPPPEPGKDTSDEKIKGPKKDAGAKGKPENTPNSNKANPKASGNSQAEKSPKSTKLK